MQKKLEIIGFDLAGCTLAQASGADRIELCADPHLGGTTPSYALVLAARQALHIPLYVMIRPRGGDFVYNSVEIERMKADIQYCKSVGCDGVVFGILDAFGKLDLTRCSQLISLAQPMGCTFHRAFDVTEDPFVAMEQIIDLGFERILSSGQKPTACDGATLLRILIQIAHGRISIMPGSGISASNIKQLVRETGAMEYHASAKRTDPSTGAYFGVDMNEVSQMKEVLLLP